MSNGNIYKWSLIERILVAAINFGGNIALARLLTTADFGLLAMIAIFTAVAYDISGCGLSDGLIHKLNPTRTDYSTVFIFNIGLGFIFGTTFILIAPAVARFFGHEELVTIMRILGICFFVQTMGFVQETKLRKDLAMKKLCFARVGATLSALILGLILALAGKGYWALVSTQIFLSVFMFLYCIAASRWFPGFKFSSKSFKEFFSYGIHLMLAYVASIIGKNINTFVLGRFYSSPSASGVYSQGAKLSNVPFAVTEASINAPFFVVVSNENDPCKQKTMIAHMFSIICGVNGTIMFFILLAAAPIITFLYGDKWIGAIPILRILAVFEFMACIKYYFQTVFKVDGRTTLIRNITILEILVQLSLLAIFFRNGIIWIAWTQLGGMTFTICTYSVMYARYMKLGFWQYLKVFTMPIAVQAGATALAVTAGIAGVYYWNGFLACAALALIYFGCILAAFETIKPEAYMALRSKIIKSNA